MPPPPLQLLGQAKPDHSENQNLKSARLSLLQGNQDGRGRRSQRRETGNRRRRRSVGQAANVARHLAAAAVVNESTAANAAQKGLEGGRGWRSNGQ